MDVGLLAFLVAILTAQTESAAQVVTNPVRLSQPSPVMPAFAETIWQDGDVTVTCIATTLGTLTDCVADTETPPGLGFANAALESATLARMQPKTVNGAAVAARINFTARFRNDPEGAQPAPPPYSGPAPSEEAMALARRIVERAPYPIEMPPHFRLPDPDQTARIEAVYAQEAQVIADGATKNLVLGLARTMPIKQMRAYLADQPHIYPPDEAIYANVAREFWIWAQETEQRLRAAWCAQAECPVLVEKADRD